MNLEERYNNASENTYVGRVRARQASDAGAGDGVNFFDGNTRSEWSPGSEAAPDSIQKEFTRGTAGDFRYGGGGKEPGAGDDYSLSRWLDKSLKIAFDGQGPSRLLTGYWAAGESKFRTIRDVRNGGTTIHNYAPVAGKKFQDLSDEILSQLSKGKITGAPSGPSPAGLNG